MSQRARNQCAIGFDSKKAGLLRQEREGHEQVGRAQDDQPGSDPLHMTVLEDPWAGVLEPRESRRTARRCGRRTARRCGRRTRWLRRTRLDGHWRELICGWRLRLSRNARGGNLLGEPTHAAAHATTSNIPCRGERFAAPLAREFRLHGGPRWTGLIHPEGCTRALCPDYPEQCKQLRRSTWPSCCIGGRKENGPPLARVVRLPQTDGIELRSIRSPPIKCRSSIGLGRVRDDGFGCGRRRHGVRGPRGWSRR